MCLDEHKNIDHLMQLSIENESIITWFVLWDWVIIWLINDASNYYNFFNILDKSCDWMSTRTLTLKLNLVLRFNQWMYDKVIWNGVVIRL